MTDVIIILIVIVVLIFAVKNSIKHFKGEGACCGGGPGTVRTKKKKLSGPVKGRKVIKISGMHCQNCVNSVAGALNALDGVSAKVSLSDGSAEVIFDREIEESELKRAVESAGFEVVNIS
ncbi:heavy-metal-associated domain-containing protein [Clostridium sp. Marseille-P3244]|uniref:heavy-metal-associated domain-containing protein n=1 Tax=Clostridium sp. Marseille-P3244 TaxID=1871020 RepID=UPI0009305C5D|nr:heavy metal-associated domain-containing protein [Clostridium sp. Marseille-P3244]